MTAMKYSTIVITAAAAVARGQASVPSGAVLVPLLRDAGQAAYLAELHVGTPPQRMLLKADSGSPTYSFIDPRNAVCAEPTQPCLEYGAFDNITSSTSSYEGTGFHNALSNHGLGDFISDVVEIAGAISNESYFGYINRFAFPERAGDPVTSILGLSLDCQLGGPQCNGPGPYLLPQLKNASAINRIATSFYLGPDETETAYPEMILGGAYDKAKIDGELFTVDMVDPRTSDLANGQTNSANVTALSVIVNGSTTLSETYGPPEIGSPVLLDTGVASWYVPNSIANAVYAGLGGLSKGEYDPSTPHQNVDCKARSAENARGSITVEFGSAGQVEIPLHRLVTKFSEDHCATFVHPRGDDVFLFGDPFFRGVYVIFDQEDFTISMANVKYTREQDIVPYPEGGFSSKGLQKSK
ncbi:eukaryotic aspartyl protease domain-containing protein [Sarocladium implicatum]|nr:eukaryotic aspartyl protease domain-containing protein [Sarocladium implicatum]